MTKKAILIGRRFERLLVVADVETENSQRRVKAICDCGVTKEYQACHLSSGRTKSCGCLQAENRHKHGLGSHPLYSIYSNIFQRTTNNNAPNFHNYGGRGIKLCEEWLKDRTSFINWALDNGWEKGLAIDRIDNNSGYSPENCRIATQKQNNINTRRSRIWTVNGKEYNSTQEAASDIGVSRGTIRRWCGRGMTNGKKAVARNGCFSRPTYEDQSNAL